MLVTGKQKAIPPELRINGSLIDYMDDFSYLGVNIRKNLSWENHLKRTKSSIIRKLHGARGILYNDQGLNLSATTWIFNAIVIPKTTYGAIAWASHDLNTKEKEILNRITRIGFNLQLNVKRSTPTKKLETLTNTAPLHLQAQGAALRAWARLRNSLGEDWDGKTSHVKRRPKAHRAYLEER